VAATDTTPELRLQAPPRRTPPFGALAVRQFRFWTTSQRRTLRGTILSALLGPTLYLTAMGVGLGTLVDHGKGLPGHVSYLVFVGSGVLAATGMQVAFADATYPVLGSVKWVGNYKAAVNTPQRPEDVLYGHVLFVVLRIAAITGFFLVVMALFGVVESPWGILAWPAAILTGAAFATPVMAYCITLDNDVALGSLFRFVMTPLFLFSGTFFPWQQLPAWAHPIAFATPLWNGVELCRSLVEGNATLGGSLLHAGYLVLFVLAGLAVGRTTFRRRLYI
jgi:lipooligosaccharide transport system permease protein